MQALVTGATGFIGGALLRRLERPRVLSRDPSRARAATGADAFPWDPESGPPPAAALEGVDAVFHLAGDPVAEGRWTPEKKARIRDSRVKGTRNLVAALRGLAVRPKVLVSASAVGLYGDRGDEVLEESAAPGSDFLASVCRDWEAMAMEAGPLGVRVVVVRIGVVLGKGGALRRMLLPFRLGVGGRLGNGRQWMPWIHVDDVVGLMLFAAGNPAVRGPLNGAAPGACTNAEFTKALGRVLRRPTLFPAPRFGLRLALGEFADILFASGRVAPRAALAAGYAFVHPEVEGALRASV
jgi:uncharacterized protein